MPLAAGLNTRADPRALRAPSLSICRNAQFDELGGLQTRYPYAAMPSGIVGGGSISSVRSLSVNGDELLAFTQERLYSFSQRDQAWVDKGLHLAAKTAETSAFARTADQVFADAAEVSGVRVVVWQEQPGAAATSDVMIAATDTVTGAVLLEPQVLYPDATRPRVVALQSTFKVYVVALAGTQFRQGIIDPADLVNDAADYSGVGSSSFATSATAVGVYDAVGVGDVSWAAADLGGGVYRVVRITGGGTVTSTDLGPVTASRLAVAVRPDGTELAVARFDGAVIRAERLNSTTLAVITSNTNVATPSSTTVNQLTACFSTGLDNEGQHRCFIFWSCGETAAGQPSATSGLFRCQTNWINTAVTIGTTRTVARMLGLASRAFAYNGRVLVWTVFAGTSEATGMGTVLGFRAAFQNAYFLYRDMHGMGATAELEDFMGSPHAKAVADRAGGFTAVPGVLPGVQAISGTSVFLWAGIERRIILLGAKQTGYSARSPRLVRLELDSNEARRTAKLGRTLYITGGLVMQYDGTGLTEVGLHIAPWSWATATLAGSLAAGSYNHKLTHSWLNAAGERERTTTVIASATAIAASQLITFASDATPFLYVTHKKGTRASPALEYWRTAVNPAQESPFHLVSDQNPANATNPNRYIANDVTDADAPNFRDDMTDAVLLTKEAYYENGGTLENLPPPPATIMIATPDRLIMAGLAEDPDTVAYSKLRGDGEVVAFHPNLRIQLPADGGPITALALLSDTLVVFKERAVFALPGEGFDNTGGGFNYGPAQTLSLDVGARSQDAVAVVPQGVVFKSDKGWHLLTDSMDVQYIGAPTYAFDADTVRAVSVLDSQHQIRFVTDSRILVWDYLASQWSEWLIQDSGASAGTMWLGQHVVVAAATGLPRKQVAAYDSSETAYGLDIETSWISFDEVRQTDLRVWRIMPLGEYRSACRLQIRLARNYQESDAGGTTYFQTKNWTISPTTVGGPLQVKHGPSIQACQVMKVRLTARHATLEQAPPGEALKLTGLAFEFGVEGKLTRRIAAAQRT